MINSMTACAAARRTIDDMTVNAEIRTYNHRHLDISLKTGRQFTMLEDRIRKLIAKHVLRGRVEIRVTMEDAAEEACVFEINGPKIDAWSDALVKIQKRAGIKAEITLAHLLSTGGLVAPKELEHDLDKWWEPTAVCIEAALCDIKAMRKKEGDFIANDFVQRLDLITKLLLKIENETQGLLYMYTQRLKDRITSLTRNVVEIDPARIAQEAAFLADRSDISEEIVRAKSHIRQFRAYMDSDEPGGRKINFLLQEMNREFTTMSSKSGNADVSHDIVTVKSELEKLREQVQNVE